MLPTPTASLLRADMPRDFSPLYCDFAFFCHFRSGRINYACISRESALNDTSHMSTIQCTPGLNHYYVCLLCSFSDLTYIRWKNWEPSEINIPIGKHNAFDSIKEREKAVCLKSNIKRSRPVKLADSAPAGKVPIPVSFSRRSWGPK